MVRNKPIDDVEKKTIRATWFVSANPKAIAHVYGVPVERILEILGMPLVGWEEIHRMHCATNHGLGNEAIVDRVIDFQGVFFEDGDYEKYQPACYMTKGSPEWEELRSEALQIPKTDDHTKEVRRLWILNRFTEHQSAEWSTLHDEMLRHRVASGYIPQEKPVQFNMEYIKTGDLRLLGYLPNLAVPGN